MELIQTVLHEAVRKHGLRTAFDSPHGRITFDRLWERVSSITGALSDLGLKKGERIGILSGNCADYIVYHYAAAKIGAILLVLNTRHTAAELTWALNDAAASVLIINESHQILLKSLTESCASIKFTIGIGSVEKATYSTDDLAKAGHCPPNSIHRQQIRSF